MTIIELYDKAKTNAQLFEKITGLNTQEFNELLAHFNETYTRKLKTNEIKLFAVLIAYRYGLSEKLIGKIILESGSKAARDGETFWKRANKALTPALQALSSPSVEKKLSAKIPLEITQLDQIDQYWMEVKQPEKTIIHSIVVDNPNAISQDNPDNFLKNFSATLKKTTTAKELFPVSVSEIKTAPENAGKAPKKKVTRVTKEFTDNITAALSFDIKNNVVSVEEKEQLVEEAAELIQEHAARRIDLLFYTMVFYYQTFLEIGISDTNSQHGQGSNAKWTNGCHSAVLPHLFDFIEEVLHEHQTRSGELPKLKRSVLDNTHFQASLNATVEAPKAVNYFDTHYLEPQMRVVAVKILNEVSCGKLTPIQGLKEFFIALEQHFKYLQKDSNYFNGYKGNLVASSPTKKIRELVFAWEKIGSFAFKWNSKNQEIIESYIHLLLKVSSIENQLLKEVSKKEKEKFYELKYLAFKREILSTKSKHNASDKSEEKCSLKFSQ